MEIGLKNGDAMRTYIFSVVSGPVIKELKINNTPNVPSSSEKILTLDPEFDPMTTEYTAGIDTSLSSAYIWPTCLDSNAVLTLTVISGVRGKNEGDTINVTTNYQGNKYFNVPFEDRTNPTTAKVKLTVASENGEQSRDYMITLYTQNALPILTMDEEAITDRGNEGAKLNVTANKDGKLYYLVQSVDMEAPDANKIKTEGQQADVTAGSNSIELTGLTRSAQRVYVILVDSSDAESSVRSAEISSLVMLGDLNNDERLTNGDVVILLDKVTAGEEVDLEVGDINNDGKITNGDVIVLLDSVTAGN